MNELILQPGATIGMLGGGQLGRMFTLEARRAGYRVLVWTDEPPGSPAGQVADGEINAPYLDESVLDEFLSRVDVVAVEFENLPGSLLEKVEARKPLRPSSRAVTLCQNREREKLFLRQNGFPCVDFALVQSAVELESVVSVMGMPSVLKTSDFGYDGRGQVKMNTLDDVAGAWERLGAPRGVVEAWVSYEVEISVLVARGVSGVVATYPVCENTHRRHILDVTVFPARIPDVVAARAEGLAREVAERLDYVGLLTVEMFLMPDGRLLINELAPRPHNSGHVTIEACSVSQFGQQLRTVTGRDPAKVILSRPAAMVNLLGDVWLDEATPPDWGSVLASPSAFLHLYGKISARQGRKMGHFTVIAESTEGAREMALRLRETLEPTCK